MFSTGVLHWCSAVDEDIEQEAKHLGHGIVCPPKQLGRAICPIAPGEKPDGFGGDHKIFLMEFSMPMTGETGFNADMPATSFSHSSTSAMAPFALPSHSAG